MVGSGEHRSEVGVLDVSAKEPKELRLKPTNFSMHDYEVRENKAAIEVWKEKTLVGHVSAVRNGEELKAEIKVLDALPDEVRRQLK